MRHILWFFGHLLFAGVHEAFDLEGVVHNLAVAQTDAEHVGIVTVGHVLDFERVFLSDKQLFEDQVLIVAARFAQVYRRGSPWVVRLWNAAEQRVFTRAVVRTGEDFHDRLPL